MIWFIGKYSDNSEVDRISIKPKVHCDSQQLDEDYTKGPPQHPYLRVIIIYTNTSATLFLGY